MDKKGKFFDVFRVILLTKTTAFFCILCNFVWMYADKETEKTASNNLAFGSGGCGNDI